MLAQRELDLLTLQAELNEFESLYLRLVGVKYAELDEIEARIAAAEAAIESWERGRIVIWRAFLGKSSRVLPAWNPLRTKL